MYELRVDFSNTEDLTAAPVSYKVSVWSRPWLNPAFEITKLGDFKLASAEPSNTTSGGYTERNWSGNDETEQSVVIALEKYARVNVAADFVMGAVKRA